MSKENVQGFYGFINDNEELNKALKEAVVAGNLVVLAKEKGFEFTQAEHDEFMAEVGAGLILSDDQLEEVAGGWPSIPKPDIPGVPDIPDIPNPQFRVDCKTCDFTTGWQSVLSYRTAAAWEAFHIADSAKNPPFTPHILFDVKTRT